MQNTCLVLWVGGLGIALEGVKHMCNTSLFSIRSILVVFVLRLEFAKGDQQVCIVSVVEKLPKASKTMENKDYIIPTNLFFRRFR